MDLYHLSQAIRQASDPATVLGTRLNRATRRLTREPVAYAQRLQLVVQKTGDRVTMETSAVLPVDDSK